MEIITNITEIVENKTLNIEENSTGYRLNNIGDEDPEHSVLSWLQVPLLLSELCQI